MSDCNFTSINGRDGLMYYENNVKKMVLIDRQDLIRALCHGISQHNVSFKGGFYGGANSNAGAGVALGKDAKAIDGATPIDALQLGTGTNSNEKTLRVYQYELLTALGKIPIERLPEEVFESKPVIIFFSNVSLFRATHNLYKEVDFNIYLSNGAYVLNPRVDRQDNYIDVNFKKPATGQIEFLP